MNRAWTAVAFVWLLSGDCFALAQDTAADASQDSQAQHRVKAFLARHCFECHRGEEPKGDLRLDRLSESVADEASREQWQAVLARVKAGEMPPKEKPRPPESEVRELTDWISARLESAAAARDAQGRAVVRRLNRVEYERTVRDLLGIEIDLRDLLPPDTSAHGFDNNGEALHTSSFLLDRYLEAADQALSVAIANGPQPPMISKRLSCQDERHVKSTTERVFLERDNALVLFSSSPWQAVRLGQFYPQDRGRYRFRISASGYQSEGRPVTFRVEAGPMLMGTKNHLVGYFDAPAGPPAVVEFVDHLEARSTIRILPYGLATAQSVNQVGADKYQGPGLAVDWIEVEGPLHDIWPPESHRRIFGDLPQAPAPLRNSRDRVEVVSNDPLADARRILKAFTRRAFRRSVSDDDIAPLVGLVEQKVSEGYSFEQAVRVGLKGAMVSPDFLFLREQPGRLDDYALASRLSYFLWSTMPDDELLTLAEKGLLSQPRILREQVERMLASPQAAAFTENFVGQWLGLRDIDFTEPDRRLYPEFDDLLKDAMVQEAHRFFDEVLKNDLSLANFVASDFTMLNERLAKHYGIDGVAGHQIRKAPLREGSHRGGVLTMAGVLKVTANGTNTSPVIRGAWVLDRILGTLPSPPPEGVSAIEPDIRGATTIREQLAKHRTIATCAACHSKIDPPGFALESFDVIGGWRDNYRSVGRGAPVTIDGLRMRYAQGPPIDAADVLPDGRQFANIDELKQLLLADQDQLARALAAKLLTYATGQAPDSADQPEIETIVATIRDQNYGLRTLVHEVVQSELFRSK